jgi:hypothetical protein
MVKLADAPRGINRGPVLDATAKSNASVTTCESAPYQETDPENRDSNPAGWVLGFPGQQEGPRRWKDG